MRRPPRGILPHRRALRLVGCALVLAGTLPAQTLDEVRRLAAAGDTTAALRAVEARLKRARRDAEAHYIAGVLYLARADPRKAVSAERRRAEEHFRFATRFGPDSAKYWMALADLFRSENVVTTRIQVAGLWRRALETAARAEDDSMAAEAEYRLARVAWGQHERFGRRYTSTEAGKPLIVPPIFAEWKYWEDFLDHGVREVPMSGEGLATAAAALRNALRRRPGYVAAAGLLVVALGETLQWEEAVPLAQRLVRVAPDSGRAWAILGLALSRTNRWNEATATFDTSLARMTPEQRAPYRNLGQIMRRADRVAWDQMGDGERARLDTLYWRAAQPLALSGTNEVQAEFYARLTYAEHRWSDAFRGYLGWESDPGVVYVRFGPPDFWMGYTAWVYRHSRFRFSFAMQPGFYRPYFADVSREALRVAQEESPARFDNIALFRTLDTILVQAARFRGARDTTDIVVFGAIPLARILDSVPIADLALASGAVLTDSAGHELQRDRRDETVRDATAVDMQHRSWRLAVPEGQYLLRVEAHVSAIDRGARGMETVNVRGFPRDRLALSDVLAADRLAARDSSPGRWTEFLIAPNGGRFRPGDPLALLWEIYNLTPDSAGRVRYGVELRVTVDAIERRTLLAQIVGGVGDAMGLTAEGDDRVSLAYERDATARPDSALVEFVTVNLRDAPEGRYTVSVTVTDRATGRLATAERAVLVNRDPPSRGRTPSSFR